MKKAVVPKSQAGPRSPEHPRARRHAAAQTGQLSDIENARSIVARAKAEAAKFNGARFDQPLRNVYGPCPGRQEGQDTGNRQLFRQRRRHAAAADHARDRQGILSYTSLNDGREIHC